VRYHQNVIDISELEKADEEVVVLIGAGAVANAWEPVLDALGDRLPDRSADTANVYFATLVHKLRWLHSMSVAPAVAAKARPTYKAALQGALHEVNSVTAAIAEHLQKWDGNKLRPAAELIRERLLPQECMFGVVTTNWDFSALEFLEDRYHDRCTGVDYIHGTYDIGLYLPGEVVDEQYRDYDGWREMRISALNTVHMLRDISRLIVYGLSISPLDGELGFLLQCAAGQRRLPFEDIIIVDPNHERVVRNLRVHLGAQNYIGVKPEELKDLKISS
jgi:hypothetical protein